MGRELARQLAAGCSVATCDLDADSVTETAALARVGARPTFGYQPFLRRGEEAQVLRFRDELVEQHASDHVDLSSTMRASAAAKASSPARGSVERTFAIDWWVCITVPRVLPLLKASADGVLVNTSSVNGFWASWAGHATDRLQHAKFAVRGFTEALIETCVPTRPCPCCCRAAGHVGTDILVNSLRAAPAGARVHERRPVQDIMPSDVQAELRRAGLLPEARPPMTCAICSSG